MSACGFGAGGGLFQGLMAHRALWSQTDLTRILKESWGTDKTSRSNLNGSHCRKLGCSWI